MYAAFDGLPRTLASVKALALMRPVDVSLSQFMSLYMISPENSQKQSAIYIVRGRHT